MAEPEFDVFISYAEADGEFVHGYLIEALHRAGLSVHTQEAFALGLPEVSEFQDGVNRSKRTLLVVSPHFQIDPKQQFVGFLAATSLLRKGAGQVIVIKYGETALTPLQDVGTVLDFTKEATRSAFLERLIHELGRTPSTPAPPPPCPYPGMRPFDATRADAYYGPQDEVDELRRDLAGHRLQVVTGPSGCGKTSLVFGGLVQSIWQRGLDGSRNWEIYLLRPDAGAIAAPSTRLASDGSRQPGPPLAEIGENPANGPVLVVVDQYEALLRDARTPDADTTALRALPEMLVRLARTERCFVVITIRADYLAALGESPLGSAIQTHRVDTRPLPGKDLERAILEPAAKSGVFIERTLVGRLVAEALAEPRALALIQEVLVLLWDRLEERFLPLSAYEELVSARYAGQVQPRTGLEVAAARHADDVFRAMPDAQQAIAKRIFMRLILFGEGTRNTRRADSVLALRAADDDKQVFAEAMERLIAGRLLVVDAWERHDRRER